MGYYLTVTESKAYLGVTGTSSDSIIDTLITASTNVVENYTGRSFTDSDQTFVEYIDGGGNNLTVTNPPITKISAIEDTFDDNNAWDSGTYESNSNAGLIYVSPISSSLNTFMDDVYSNKWGEGRRRYKVTYSGSYATSSIPEAVRIATLMILSDMYQTKGTICSSERIGNYTYNLRTDTGLSNRDIKCLLNKYKNLYF